MLLEQKQPQIKLEDSKTLNWFILILVGVSCVVSDWMISLFTVSDFIFGIIFLLIVILSKIRLEKEDIIRLISLESFVVLINIINLLLNDSFSLKVFTYNFIKFSFYCIVSLYLYKFFSEKNLLKGQLIILNVISVITIIIGVYITVIIMNDIQLPYDFFWALTRSDRSSYTLRGTTYLIRTRSIFAEPAHFGYFLNMVLGLNFFSICKKNISKYFNLILIIGIILTFSYASIAVALVLVLLKITLSFRNFKIEIFNKKMGLLLLIVMLVLFIFKDFIYVGIVQRTIEIVNGSDNSSINRLISSWEYVNFDWILLGNGLGHTPPIQNIYAYILSDLGLISFLLFIVFTFKILTINFGIGITFLILNFQKGGYLTPLFYLLILFIVLYSKKKNLNHSLERKILK